MNKKQALLLLENMNLTQLDMASRLKMSPVTIRKYLNNEDTSRRTQESIERFFDELIALASNSKKKG